MEISIIVPVYNMAADGKLNFCLDSLINQTITDYEIIAVNDASTDNSLEVLRDYESKYPDLFKVITYHDNRHQGGARNEGIKIAKGDFIAFIDSDDWVSPDYYEKLLNTAKETGADAVASNYTIVYDHTFTPGKLYECVNKDVTGVLDIEKRKRLLMNAGSLVMKIYRRELILQNHLYFPEHMFYEDNAMGCSYSMYIKHLEICEGPLYYYYMRGNSTTHTVTEAASKDRLKAMEIMVSEMKARGFYKAYKDEVEQIFIRLYLIGTLFGYMIDCKHKHFSFVKEIKRGVLTYIPDFRSNKYYDSIPEPEQRKMLDLFMKNALAFYLFYGAKWKYRHFIKKVRHEA